MKRGTPGHPKMHELARRLRVPHYAAIGLIESLWHWSATYTPRGDLGRYPNAAIASGCHWLGDPDVLISALVGCRWVDETPICRLAVHDIQDHADDGLRKVLRKRGWRFWNGAKPYESTPDEGLEPPPAGPGPPGSIRESFANDSRQPLPLPQPSLSPPSPVADPPAGQGRERARKRDQKLELALSRIEADRRGEPPF